MNAVEATEVVQAAEAAEATEAADLRMVASRPNASPTRRTKLVANLCMSQQPHTQGQGVPAPEGAKRLHPKPPPAGQPTVGRTRAIVLNRGKKELSEDAQRRADAKRTIVGGIMSRGRQGASAGGSDEVAAGAGDLEVADTQPEGAGDCEAVVIDAISDDDDAIMAATPCRLSSCDACGGSQASRADDDPNDASARVIQAKVRARARARQRAAEPPKALHAYGALKSRTQQKREAVDLRDRSARVISGVYRTLLRKRRAQAIQESEYRRRAEKAAKIQAAWRAKKIRAFVGYRGEMRNGRAHGVGRMVWADGSYYEGGWKEGVPDGWGEVVWPDGSYYAGEWARGERRGQGLHESARGDVYEGGWEYDRPHGEGTRTASDGSSSQGTWVGGKLDGRAVIIAMSGDGSSVVSEYRGMVEEGEKIGVGVERSSDGEYRGQWASGMQACALHAPYMRLACAVHAPCMRRACALHAPVRDRAVPHCPVPLDACLPTRHAGHICSRRRRPPFSAAPNPHCRARRAARRTASDVTRPRTAGSTEAAGRPDCGMARAS